MKTACRNKLYSHEHFRVLLSLFSGLPRQEKPSVVSIETKCHLGELHWAEPFGGLRVTFNPRDVHVDYKLCFTARHPGVRIYQEHLQNLALLTGAAENVTRNAVCVKSTAGQGLVLYLETQEDQKMTQLNYTVLVNGRKRPRNDRRKGERNEPGKMHNESKHRVYFCTGTLRTASRHFVWPCMSCGTTLSE